MHVVHIDIARRWWLDDNLPRLWLRQIPLDENVIDKQPKPVSDRQRLLSTAACEQTTQQATPLFTPFTNPEQLFLLELFWTKQVSVLLSANTEVKELCPHQC